MPRCILAYIFFFFSKNYKVFYTTVSGVTSRSYYTFKNGNYYLLVPTSTTTFEELIYLKDSNSVGKKWSLSINYNGSPVVHNYEVIENGISKTINGLNFSNVVHVKLSIPVSGYVANSYYSPKVGLIKTDELSGGNTYVTEIKSYSIK